MLTWLVWCAVAAVMVIDTRPLPEGTLYFLADTAMEYRSEVHRLQLGDAVPVGLTDYFSEQYSTFTDLDCLPNTHSLYANGIGIVKLDGRRRVDMYSRPYPDSDRPVNTFAVSPTKRILAYSVRVIGAEVLFTMPPAGIATQLTDNTYSASAPDWSPDESKIVFEYQSQDNKHRGLAVIGADGTGLRLLTQLTINFDLSPAWSPDGATILFYSNRSGTWQIYSVAADGNGLRQITTSGENFSPAWSPDGTAIAFSSSRSGQGRELFVANPDGSQPRQVTNLPLGNASQPCWVNADR